WRAPAGDRNASARPSRDLEQPAPLVYHRALELVRMSPIHALGSCLISPFQVLVGQRGTIELFVRREIRGRYVNSVLGLSWAVIQPLALLALSPFVFSHVMKVRFTGDGAAANFPLYLFCGMLPWLAFADGVTRASSVLVEQTPLIKKVVFPTEILPATV